MEYTYTDEMAEVSGLGGDYEKACREMVIAGAEWVDEHDVNLGEDYGAGEELKDVMAEELDSDPTVAMMHAATRHVAYVDKHGWEAYVEKMEEDDD